MEWDRSFYFQQFSVADIHVLNVWDFLGTVTCINLDQVNFRPRLNIGSRLNTVISVPRYTTVMKPVVVHLLFLMNKPVLRMPKHRFLVVHKGNLRHQSLNGIYLQNGPDFVPK